MELSDQPVRVLPDHFELFGSPKSNIRNRGETSRKIYRKIHFVTKEGKRRKGWCYKWDMDSQVVSCLEVHSNEDGGEWWVEKIIAKQITKKQFTESEMIVKLELLRKEIVENSN